jgi:hypothetical protein
VDTIKLLRDQIIFLGAFVLVFGLIRTDVYYAAFGLKYQSLNLGYQHIVYRGATLGYDDVSFIILFFCISAVLLLSQYKFKLAIGKFFIPSTIIAYILFSTLASLGIYISFQAGIKQAIDDMYPETTTLRQLIEFHSENSEKTKYVNKLINATDTTVLIVYRTDSKIAIFTSPSLKASRPRVRVHEIGISSNDYYSNAIPRFR